MWFVSEYLSIAENMQLDYKDYGFTFNKSLITNETETISNVVKSKGVISDETVIANHPWTDDVQEELDRVKKQEEEFDAKQEPLGGEEIEPTGN